ncbi:hypothetical protein BDA96_06G084800 [Sorghum bicolor]|uniref:Uncharacterized protein n=1 Tax=Sorghum bicolor TaxID=4558 RepID=A0A921UBD2_SORBI|nr:hypothetical protein BDA96_06G084800 [Sorghum bicolor]
MDVVFSAAAAVNPLSCWRSLPSSYATMPTLGSASASRDRQPSLPSFPREADRAGERRQIWADGRAMVCGQASGSDKGGMRPLVGSRKASHGDLYKVGDEGQWATAYGQPAGGNGAKSSLLIRD